MVMNYVYILATRLKGGFEHEVIYHFGKDCL